METPAALLAYQLLLVEEGSTATGPPSPPRISFQSPGVAGALAMPVTPLAPRPASMVEAEACDCARESTSASEPRLLLRFWRGEASVVAQTEPVSATASRLRQRPLSLPK